MISEVRLTAEMIYEFSREYYSRSDEFQRQVGIDIFLTVKLREMRRYIESVQIDTVNMMSPGHDPVALTHDFMRRVG